MIFPNDTDGSGIAPRIPSLGTGLAILNGPGGEIFKECLKQALIELRATRQAGPSGKEAPKAYQTAVAALEMFLDRPGTSTAAEALIALSAWDGPVGSRFLEGLLPLLSMDARTKLLITGLELYISGGGSGV